MIYTDRQQEQTIKLSLVATSLIKVLIPFNYRLFATQQQNGYKRVFLL